MVMIAEATKFLEWYQKLGGKVTNDDVVNIIPKFKIYDTPFKKTS